MKAARMPAYGGPEVLQLAEVARPVPATDKALVQVVASGVNRVDVGSRSGSVQDRMPVPLPYNLPLAKALRHFD